MSTGYFVSRSGKRGATHYVSLGKPICGVRVQPRTYQACAGGFEFRIVECARCRRTLKRIVPEVGR
jgi:hypothetical protein